VGRSGKEQVFLDAMLYTSVLFLFPNCPPVTRIPFMGEIVVVVVVVVVVGVVLVVLTVASVISSVSVVSSQ